MDEGSGKGALVYARALNVLRVFFDQLFQHIDDRDTVTEGAPKTDIDMHIGEAVQPTKAVCGAGQRY